MKRSDLLLASLLVVLSCSERRESSYIINSLFRQASLANALTRKVAATPIGNQCLKDKFSVPTLEDEIAELERPSLNAEKIEGNWHDIDLSSLKVPEANFLNSYGDQIGDITDPGAIDYSGCKNLPCIFNRIYGKEEGVAGLVHYLWYLKFGHMLALDNHVPRQKSGTAGVYNGKSVPLKDYLFNQKELYGLWRLTHILGAPHTGIAQLRQIQRVPRGETFEESDYKEACGLASNGGWIKLTDKCLVIEQDIDQGHLYPSIVHEIGHQIDYEEGKRLYKASHRSHQKDYLKLSGFYLHEYKDAQGNIHRSWKRKKGPLLTNYAGVSPQENFAEVTAWFRVDGDLARKKMTQDHFNFISKNYYGNKKFGKEWLVQSWISVYSADFNQETTRAFIECSGGQKCTERRGPEIERDVRARVMIKEAEGCKVFNDKNASDRWQSEASLLIKKIFDGHRKSMTLDKKYLARLRGLSSGQAGPEIASSAFVECSGGQHEQDCYADEVRRKIEDEKLAQVYLSFYPWGDIREKSLSAYRSHIMSREDDLRKSVRKVWKGCLINPNDQEVPSGGIFLLSDGYMISSLYNCLNAQLPESIKEIVRALGVQHGKEEALLYSEVQSRMVSLLRDIYERERTKEVRGCAPDLPLYHLKQELPNPSCSRPKTRP